MGITLSKPHLVCTFYDKQINVKKYEWKFGSVQILLVGDCIGEYLVEYANLFIRIILSHSPKGLNQIIR